MINKLRKKIFWIIQISLSIIILGIIILFTSFSYKNTITSSTMFIDRIVERENGPFTEPRTDINIEGIYKFEIINNNIIKESNGVTDEIRNYSIKVSNKIQDEGYINNYIYQVRKFGNDVKEITLIENENAINRLKITILVSISIGILGILGIYIIAKKISILIVKPVEDSFEKQKQFVSDASHELKTPLAVIEANADVLQDQVGESKWITYIQNEVKSMNKLVNDLLTLAKMENTNVASIQKFDISKEIQMEVAVFESIIFEKKINLETNITEGIDFNGDKDDIKHIISIILDNAIKHTKEGKRITVNAGKEKNDIKIEIKNEGDPIPEEDKEKIFERFYRVDKARNRSEKRYGLGLAIAKEIVSKYNGNICAFSKDGVTSFVIKLKNK